MLCLDDLTYDILQKLHLKNVIPIRVSEIEDDELREAKKDRTISEYSWTLKPSMATYILKKHPEIKILFYIDTDIYFYSSIEPLYEEMGDASVMLFPHRLPKGKKYKEEEVGKYNGGMIMFRNVDEGKRIIEWWRQQCNEWCYLKAEPGKLGDQKYLDYFEEKFEGVKISENLGADVATWNIKNYRGTVQKIDGQVYVLGVPLICFHFSVFRHYYPSYFFLPNGPATGYDYTLPSPEKTCIYDEYMAQVYEGFERIRIVHPGFRYGATTRPSLWRQVKKDIFLLVRMKMSELIDRILGRTSHP
ncbi:MAG: hypothetical protein V4465_00100 [Patescibacteria group bacterium]